MKRFCLFLISVIIVSMLIPSFALFADGESMIPLDNIRSLGGNWSFGESEYSCSGGGDMFALSDSRSSYFAFEAEAEFVNRRGAVSLVFFSSDNPSRGSYVANIDLNAGNARIFKFESAGGATTKGEYILPQSLKQKSVFRLRVEASGGDIIFFIDNYPAVHITDNSAKPGERLGLLTFDTSAKYRNVRYVSYSKSAPVLNALTGEDISFSGKSYTKLTLPFGTEKAALTAAVPSGCTLGALIPVAAAHAEVSVSGNTVTLKDLGAGTMLILQVIKGDIMKTYAVEVEVGRDPSSVYNEASRPQFHFSPFKNWMNDPNGLVFDPSNNTWHLFFQYNPYGLNIANQVWGHAESTDLIHWKEIDIAIAQDHLGAVFSGSALVDEDNTSGFFTDNKPGESKLVAIYTSDGGDTTHGVEKQCIAYSKDHGHTWIKPSIEKEGFENPIIPNDNNKYGRDFRDPKIFRYDNRWFMAVAGGRARLFTSDDLIHWTQVCDMGFDSECPDFYPLPVDGNKDNIKWVYTASGKWYVVGRLEKVSEKSYKFVAEGERTTYNGGNEMYATQSYYNDGSGQNRRIAISWIQDSSASSVPSKGWNGAMSLPLEQTLRTVNGKIILTSYPVSELEALRSAKVIDLKDASVDKLNDALFANPGTAYDFEAVIKPESGAKVTFTLRSNGINRTDVVYDGNLNRLQVIRSTASPYGGVPTSTMQMPLYPDKDGKVTVRVVMDKSVIEAFGNTGEAPCSGMIFPSADCIGSSVKIEGKAEIKSFVMYRMESSWHKGEEILPEPGVYISSDDIGDIGTGSEATLDAYTVDNDGKVSLSGVSWSVPATDVVSVVSNNNGKLTVKGLKKGNVTLTAEAGGKSRKITVRITSKKFDSDLTGWTSNGDWYIGESGYTIDGSNGDSFAFSNVRTDKSFVYSGQASFTKGGGCLGLVFGATRPDNPPSGTWFGANIDTHGSKPTLKLFQNTNGTEIWRETYTFDSAATVWNLEVRYENGTITYTVNGKSVSHKLSNLTAGTLGLVSWSGGGSFDNVNYRSLETPEPPVTQTEKPTTQAPVTDISKPETETEKPDTQTEKPETDKTSTDKPASGSTGAPGTEKPGTGTAGTDKAGSTDPSTSPSTDIQTKDPVTTEPDTQPEKPDGQGEKKSLAPLFIAIGAIAAAAAVAVGVVITGKKKK